MKCQYTILPEPLHPIADLAITYFVKRRGVSGATVKVEKPVDERLSLDYRPTFTAKTTDHYILCIDVGESVYHNSLDAFVLDCINKSLPVKLFIAIPKGNKDPEFSKKFNAARDRGVGVLEVDSHSTQVVLEALPLSLAGVRPIAVQDFPAKLRENLNRAETIFRNGSPDKACSLIFDEIESICRSLGKKTYTNNCWSPTTTLNFKFESDPWAKLMVLLDDHLDVKKAKCPRLTKAFLARIHGITPHRNESGHKPINEEALKKRDREIRTRFESAVDLLYDLVAAVKPLRVI
jgi:hypothetical protein